MMNNECELKFFGLEFALELDLTLKPKLTFQEFVLFQEDLDTHTPLKKQVESYCEDEYDKNELLPQAKFKDDLINFVRRIFLIRLNPKLIFSSQYWFSNLIFLIPNQSLQ